MYEMNCAHPEVLLSPLSVKVVRNAACAAETSGRLTAEQLNLVYNNNWFNIFVPGRFGGLNMEFPKAVRLLEALAWADGSFGWTVTLCSGANWFVGFFDTTMARDIFKGPQTCLAGSGAPTGTAVLKQNGYVVNGEWKYITGAPFATAFTANCIVEGEGKSENAPVVKPFIFLPHEVDIKEDWHGVGMKATASYIISAKNLFIPGERMFDLAPDRFIIKEPIYKLPFLQFAEVTLAANFSGMAYRFIDLCAAVLDKRIKEYAYNVEQASEMLEALGRMRTMFDHHRTNFMEAVTLAWLKVNTEGDWSRDHLTLMSKCAYSLAKTSVKAADVLFPYCGMLGADTRTEINRVWRDLHTASQHAIFMFKESKE